MDPIEQMKSIDFNNCTPETVRKLLINQKCLYVPFLIDKGIYVLRGRKGGGFTKRSQMTYCPVELCNYMQRATLAGQTMFYGVISDDQSHQEKARAIVASECSQLWRIGTDSYGIETFTVSHWEVIKPLYIVSLINDTTFPEITDNALLNQLRKTFVQLHSKEKTSNAEKEFSRFISSEFCKLVKNSNEYLISATVATDIIKDKSFDGIVYPSVPFGGQAGLNIALTPNAVNHKLRFRRTLEQTLYKNGEHSFLRMEKAEGKRLFPKQVPDTYIEKELNINSLSDLPEIK